MNIILQNVVNPKGYLYDGEDRRGRIMSAETLILNNAFYSICSNAMGLVDFQTFSWEQFDVVRIDLDFTMATKF